MKLTPSSTARRRTAIAVAGSLGGPQIPSPVRRMAPKPRRLTVSSPPRSIVPLSADRLVFFSLMFLLHRTYFASYRFVYSATCQLESGPRLKCLPSIVVELVEPRSFSYTMPLFVTMKLLTPDDR